MKPPITKLAYRVWQPTDKVARHDAIRQMQGSIKMADYHFRVNVEHLGVDPRTVITQIEWPEGKIGECRFLIEATAPEELHSTALGKAVQLVDLRADRC